MSLGSDGINLNLIWMGKEKFAINKMNDNDEFYNDMELQYDC